MTYCLAIALDAGLVLCSDSRTNAGADRVSAFSKLHRYGVAGQRQIVLLSSGNLGTTQAVRHQIERDLNDAAAQTVNSARDLDEVADYIGRLSVSIQQKYAPGGDEAGFNAEASFILGGQIQGHQQQIFLIYPEGNHIRPSRHYPFLQIGETKYGKPILERLVDARMAPEIAMRCALVSMDSTIRSNATVGAPVELLFLPAGDLDGGRYYSFERDDPYLLELRDAWSEEMERGIKALPALPEPHG